MSGPPTRATHRRIRDTVYNGEGKVIRDDKADVKTNSNTIYSADGKRIIWTNRNDLK
jgi:hypothetical protein